MRVQVTATYTGLEQDIEKEKKAINEQVNIALNFMGSEMQRDLQTILWDEWYKKYTPTRYIRRTDNKSLGTPLGDNENFDISVKNQTLEFVYSPTGVHANPEWTNRSGDDLITWIQKAHYYAEAEDGEVLNNIPSRPFWNIFIDKQMDEKIIDNFIEGMSPKYTVTQDKNDDFTDLAQNYLPEGQEVHKIG